MNPVAVLHAAGPLRFLLPLLLAFALLEGLILTLRRPERFDWKESLATLGVALGHGLAASLSRGLFGGMLVLAWQYRIYTVPIKSAFGLLALLVVSEFFYYWEHRLSHTMRWFWASHAVHHSIEHLNFLAAYRLGWTGSISGLPLIFAPMLIMGFSPLAVATMLAINLSYQFWLHNEWMPKLGALEWVLNTPSSHRVHHAKNEQYLNKNYGGILIIFDRLFRTYAKEEEACRYGLVHGVKSYNPLRIALSEWHAIWSDLVAQQTFKSKFVAVFGAPGALLGAQRVSVGPIEGYDGPFTARESV